MKALYICNNREEWEELQLIFKSHFSSIELICTTKGADSMDLLTYEGPFGAIIIDAALKDESPTELAQNIVDQAGERPILFIGTENIIKQRINDEFYLKNELADYYQKPINIPTLKEKVNAFLNWAKEEDFEQSVEEISKDEFLPVKIRNFRLFDSIPFDAYIELTQTKFIKAFQKNTNYNEAEIQAIVKRGIKHLYLKKDEHLKFLETSIAKLSKKLRQKLGPKQLIQAQVSSSLVINQYLKDVGISKSVIEITDLVIETANKIYDKYDNFVTILNDFPLENGDTSERSILIMYFCETLTRGMGWNSDISRKKLGLASIIHDCDLENEELIRIPSLDHPDLEAYKEEEVENLKNHMNKAALLSEHFSGYSDVEFIIKQHHERPDGNGFPGGFNASKIIPVCSIFILSHFIVNFLAMNGTGKKSLARCMNEVNSSFNIGNFKEPLAILKRVLKGYI